MADTTLVHAVALKKADGQRYVLVFDAASACEAVRELGRWAGNPELGFTWYDAAMLSRRVTALLAES